MGFVFGADAGMLPCLLMALAVVWRSGAATRSRLARRAYRNLHLLSWLLFVMGNLVRARVTPLRSRHGLIWSCWG